MFHFDKDFVDKNAERYMFPIRLRSLLRKLESRYVLRKELSTGDLRFLSGDRTYAQMDAADGWEPFLAGLTLWGEPDLFVWFRQTVTIPQEFAGEDVWYCVEPWNKYGEWPWGQPQIQLFVNGRCVYGLDNNHQRYLLIKNAHGGEVFDIALKAYSDRTYFQGKMTMSARIQITRPRVRELAESIRIPLEAAAFMHTDSDARILIVDRLNTVMNMLDLYADPDSAEFIASMEKAENHLDTELYGALRDGSEPVLWSFGHSHIDVAWLWTYHVTRNKAARTFATNLRLLEDNPDYLFMSSQPQLYEFVKQDDPQMYEKIKEAVRQGRWEAEGGMWVEADTNITGGESLVRQFLFGKRFFKEEFGVDNKVLWLPDVFGYSANLPQICKRSGIDYFYTTKIGWNEYNKLPYDTFRWRGLDGSTVLTHFGCAISYADQEKDWMTTYNPDMHPSFILGAWQRYQQKDINRELLYDFGYGDGGGGPTQEMIDHARRYQKGIPGCPRVKFAKVIDYFKRLDATVSDHPRLPEWDGEMYLEFHRGTYTSQAKVKKNNRKSEQLYHDAENLSSMAALLDTGIPYPTEKLHENWKLILLNQFHDVLPGSSIKEVYQDVHAYYDKILSEGTQICQASASALAKHIGTDSECVVVFNTLSFDRSPVVIFDGELSGLMTADGQYVPCQRTHDGKTVFIAPHVPAKGWRSYRVADAVSVPSAVVVRKDSIENQFLQVRFDEKMHIRSLFSKSASRETLPEGSIAGRVIAYEDVCLKDDAWNVQAYYQERSFVLDDVTDVRVLESGPVRGVIRVTRRFRSSTVQTDIIAYAGCPQLQFDHAIDWHEHDLFVKAEFPVDVNAKAATYEIQFGHVQRPVHKNTLWDFARFEVCGHKWADLSDAGFGLAILNDCKYGFDATRNCLRISLLKCSTYPDKEQDQGFHSFSYALYPHSGDHLAAQVRDRAYDFNFAAHAVHIPGAQTGGLPEERSLFRLSASNVVLETVKQAEDSPDLILRLYEAENKATCCTLSMDFPVSAAIETNLMEEDEQTLEHDDGCLQLRFKPFEIKTIRVKKG